MDKLDQVLKVELSLWQNSGLTLIESQNFMNKTLKNNSNSFKVRIKPSKNQRQLKDYKKIENPSAIY